MSPRKNLVLLGALALLVLVYYVFDVKEGEERRRAAQEASRVLRQVSRAEIVRVSWKGAKEPYELMRSDGRWELSRPLRARADSQTVEGILRAVAGLQEGRLIGKKVEDLKTFGLEKPAFTLEVGLQGGKVRTLLLGDENPTKSYRYAKLADSGRVFLVDADFKDKLDRELYRLRDKTILPLKADKVQRLVVHKGGKVIEAVKRGKEKWDLVQPVRYAADSFEVETAIGAVADGRVKRFVEEAPKDLARYGLAEPAYRVQFFPKDAKRALELLIGKAEVREVEERGKKEKRTFYFAKRLDRPNVFQVNEELFKDLPQSAFQIRDKKVYDYDVDEVARLEIETPRETVEIRRRGKKSWEIVKPFQARGDHQHIDDVLWDIKWAKATGFVDDPEADLSRYGLQSPAAQVRVVLKGEKKPLEFALGPLKDKRAYGRRAGEKVLFSLGQADYKKIVKTAFYLKYRRLYGLERDAIARVAIEWPKEKLSLERREFEWFLRGKKGKADTLKVNDLVDALRELEYEKEVKPAPGAPYDFSKPRIKVILYGKGDKTYPTFTLASGGTDKFLFGQMSHRPGAVLLLDRKNLERSLPKDAAALLPTETS
ncbi:MAG: DUF4340 domain-containing protein [Nitrospinota bacterium]